MITKFVKQSPVYSEFTPEEQTEFFDLSRDKVASHIDTLYYTVSVYNDSKDVSENMQALLDRLRGLREQKALNYSSTVDFYGLSVENVRFVHYEYCLRLNENFDIFIASLLPNPWTPRIVVQLRTRSLVLDGPMQAVCKSFRYVERILNDYGLEVGEVKENRIDYAYHTNIMQDPYSYFCDRSILKRLKTQLRHVRTNEVLIDKIQNVGVSKIDLSYISFGDRKSNNVFVRIYNKTREVVEKNYKSFFLDKWLTDKLINRYDHYVYSHAYSSASYVTGVLVGRIDWYLEYGHNDEIKQKLAKVKESCYVRSDNTDQLRKIVDRYLPPVTLIMNVEYQTKREFYKNCDDFIQLFITAQEQLPNCQKVGWNADVIMPLQRLHIVYSLRSEILDYLTTKTLCFVNKKGTDDEKMCYWWKRIHEVSIKEQGKHVLSLWRTNEQNTDIERSKRDFCSSVARFSIINSGKVDLEEKPNFMQDLSDVLCFINDNDMHNKTDFFFDMDKISDINPEDYDVIKRRKARQLNGILEKKQEKDVAE